MSMVSRRFWMAWVLLVAGVLGCSNAPPELPLPQTYPVAGKVVFRDGKAFPGGLIQLISKGSPSWAITGEIDVDGTFTVDTLFQGERFPGAVPGPCRAMVSARPAENKPVEIYQPVREYVVKEGDNQFVIEIDSQRR